MTKWLRRWTLRLCGLCALGCDGTRGEPGEFRYYALVDEACGVEQCELERSIYGYECVDRLRREYDWHIAVGCESETRTLYQCLAGKGCAPSPYVCPTEMDELLACLGGPRCVSAGGGYTADDDTDVVTSCRAACDFDPWKGRFGRCEAYGNQFRCQCEVERYELGGSEFFIPNCQAATISAA
ncbi:MAG TPA: hypothetical protein VHO25_19165, partial [Polyangiaceae bacterium]|nr:hypothetical protein [Polyangiaceae bacterium]